MRTSKLTLAFFVALVLATSIAVACSSLPRVPFFSSDPTNEQAPTPDLQATIDAAVRTLEASQTPAPIEAAPYPSTTTPDVQSIQSTLDAMVSTIAASPTTTPAPQPTATAQTTGAVPAQPEPTAIRPPSPTSIVVAAPTPSPRPEAPLFSGQLLDGTEFHLEETLGKPVLLMFWAPW